MIDFGLSFMVKAKHKLLCCLQARAANLFGKGSFQVICRSIAVLVVNNAKPLE